jgi:hypothetical protein
VSAKRILTPGTLICTLLCLLGVTLLVLAIPRTVAAWAARDMEPSIAKLNRAVRPSRDELIECVKAGQEAVHWVGSARRWANLSRCELELARQAPRNSSVQFLWLARAEDHTKKSLLANPADGYAWLRLAVIRMARGAEAGAIVSPLMTSLDTAPNRRLLWWDRAWMLLSYAPQMTPDELLILRHQLRTIWIHAPSYRPHLLESAHTLDRLNVLTWALADEP